MVAAAIVEELRPDFGDENVVFIDFDAVSEPDLVPGAVIAAVGCTLGSADPVDDILALVGERRMLIVFDSCEHLIDAVSLLVGRLFSDAKDVHVLVTSREALRVEGEAIHFLIPLAYPTDELPMAAEALATPAVQLFMDRARSAGFQQVLSDVEAPVVCEICRRTDGIPLAIELAASRVGTYGIRGVASLLASNAELHLVGRRNAAPRHRTLEAMLDWSFRLLDEYEQRILCRLSVLVGPFTMDAACAVAGDGEHANPAVMTAVTSLVDKSLIWVDPTEEAVFYRLAETTRVYAEAKLTQTGEMEAVVERHARHFVDVFKTIALEHGAYADLARYARHLGNVRKALDWSFSREEHRAIGVELAADAAPLFLGLWLLTECRHWSRLALNTMGGITEFSRRETRLLEALAVSSIYTRGNMQEMCDVVERGLNRLEADASGSLQLRLWGGLNVFLHRLGDFEGGLAAAKRCTAIADASGTLGDRVVAQWMLGISHHLAGDHTAAIDHCERGFALESDIGRVAINLFGYDHHLRAELALARSLWLTGRPRSARRVALELMDKAARSPLPGDYGLVAAHAIPVLLWNGETEAAAGPIECLMGHAEKHALKSHAAAAQALRGEWLLMAGEPQAALETLQRAFEMLNREQFRMVMPGTCRAIAEALDRSGRRNEARAAIDRAISSARQMGQRFWLPELLRTRGQIGLSESSPDTDAAEAAFRCSIRLAGEQSAPAWQLKAAIPLAHLMRRQGRDTDAIALIQPLYEAHAEKTGTKDLAEASLILAQV